MEVSPKFLLELSEDAKWARSAWQLPLPPLGEGLSDDEANVEEIRVEGWKATDSGEHFCALRSSHDCVLKSINSLFV